MTGLVLCEPTELYNILNQVTKLSRLTEPNYLCLLDVRSKWEYDESHVITALLVKKRAGKYLIPESVDLECVEYCVIYDNNTISPELMLKDDASDDDGADDGKHSESVPEQREELSYRALLPHAGSSAWATSTEQPDGDGSVRTWEGSGMFPSLQSDKRVCRGFVDAGARPEAPGSEIKDFISQSNRSSQKAVGGIVSEL